MPRQLQRLGKGDGVGGDPGHIQLGDDVGQLAVIQAIAFVDGPLPQQAPKAAVDGDKICLPGHGLLIGRLHGRGVRAAQLPEG